MEGEDITTNTLARLISEVEPSIWQEAAQREWRVCLPQSFSIRRDLRKEDICMLIKIIIVDDHVLIPTNQAGKYKTKSGKTIRLSNNEITTCEGFPESRTVKVIVTQEVIVPSAFDGASTSICLIFYINSPLTGGIDAPSGVDNMTFSNLSEYLAFIFSYPENEVVLASLDKFIRNVKKSLKDGKHLFITPLSGQLCRRCDETVSYIRNTSALREAMLNNNNIINNNNNSNSNSNGIVDNKRYHAYDKQLRQCVESYLLFNLYNEIYKSLLIEHEDETDMLEKGIMYMRKKKKSDFDIKDKYNCDTSSATKVLSKISTYKTPLEKAQCLQYTSDTILDCVRENIKQRNINNNNNNKTDDLETDDLLAQLIYTICDSYPATKYLYVDLIYIYDYHFENISVTNMGYTITNVEVALNWLKNQSSMRSKYIINYFILYSEATPVAARNVTSIMKELPILEPPSTSSLNDDDDNNDNLQIPPCLIYDNDYLIGNSSSGLTSPSSRGGRGGEGHEDYSPSYRTYSNSRTIPHMSSWSNFSNKSQIRLSRFGSYTKLTSSPTS